MNVHNNYILLVAFSHNKLEKSYGQIKESRKKISNISWLLILTLFKLQPKDYFSINIGFFLL